jgi:universal stress protein E
MQLPRQAAFDEADPQDHASPALRRILVVVDPAATRHPEIDKAVRLAEGSGALVELFAGDDGEADADSRQARHRQLLDFLQELAAPLRARRIGVSVESEWCESLERGIGLRVVRTSPDLVVKLAQRQPTPTNGSLNSTDWTLIRHIAPPLLLIGPEPWPAQPAITVGADPCHPADRPSGLDSDLVAIASLFANALGGVMDVMHVLQTPPHLPGEAVTALEKARSHGSAREAVERVVAGATNCAAPVAIHFIEGRVAQTLTRFAAERRPTLMVLGASARTRWANISAGGTAAQILENLVCDVLIVKPVGFVSPLLVTDE